MLALAELLDHVTVYSISYLIKRTRYTYGWLFSSHAFLVSFFLRLFLCTNGGGIAGDEGGDSGVGSAGVQGLGGVDGGDVLAVV